MGALVEHAKVVNFVSKSELGIMSSFLLILCTWKAYGCSMRNDLPGSAMCPFNL